MFLQHRTAGGFSASRVFTASMVFSQPSKESIFLASEQCFLRPECFFSIEKEVFSKHQSGIFRASKCFLDTCGVFSQHRNGVFPASERCFFSSAVFSPHRKSVFQAPTERERDREKRDRE